MLDHLFTLLMLILLQAVLGLDNLLYISLESKTVPVDKQAYVRKMGIGMAIILRIVLLFVLTEVIQFFQDPVFGVNIEGILEFNFNIHSLIVLVGGVFIMYTAVNEIWRMMSLEENEEQHKKKSKSVKAVIIWIVIMNLVFSFDSILSAMALSDNFYVMAIAIVIGGLLMIWLSGTISDFLHKNRMYEVLGLFILLIVGIMLLSEGGEMGKLTIFNIHVEHMSKSTFYFVIFVLIAIDIIQSRYRKKLLKQKEQN